MKALKQIAHEEIEATKLDLEGNILIKPLEYKTNNFFQQFLYTFFGFVLIFFAM